MDINMNRREFLRKAGLFTAGMAAAGAMRVTAGFAEESPVYTPGEYTAVATGFRDAPVKVTMTFDEKSITNVVVDASSQTENIGGAAVQALEAQIMAAQSSAIDGVTGATVTSRAVKSAAAECIKQASGGWAKRRKSAKRRSRKPSKPRFWWSARATRA